MVPGRGTPDDGVLRPRTSTGLLASEVVVEEKVDGANVSIWVDDEGVLECASRGGPGARDRAGQLGPLRAWMAGHDPNLREVLDAWPALYAEWMLLAHTIAYDRLPSYLVGLDLWDPDRGFATVDDRNAYFDRAGLIHPPELWRGVVGSAEALEDMIGQSAWGSEPAEGVVVRRLDGGEPRIAKLLRPGFRRLGDADWGSGRPRNSLAGGQVSWR